MPKLVLEVLRPKIVDAFSIILTTEELELTVFLRYALLIQVSSSERRKYKSAFIFLLLTAVMVSLLFWFLTLAINRYRMFVPKLFHALYKVLKGHTLRASPETNLRPILR